MEHFYKEIEGRFTWPGFYAWLAREVPAANARIVEVGTYEGQSAAHLGVELLDREPLTFGARLDLVDVFDVGQILSTRERLKPIWPVLGLIHGCGSVEASKKYADHSLDAVFIDADHAYASVRADIDASRAQSRSRRARSPRRATGRRSGGWTSGSGVPTDARSIS